MFKHSHVFAAAADDTAAAVVADDAAAAAAASADDTAAAVVADDAASAAAASADAVLLLSLLPVQLLVSPLVLRVPGLSVEQAVLLHWMVVLQ